MGYFHQLVELSNGKDKILTELICDFSFYVEVMRRKEYCFALLSDERSKRRDIVTVHGRTCRDKAINNLG